MAGRREDVTLADLRIRHLLPLWVVGITIASVRLPLRFGYDSHAYWLTAHHAALYPSGVEVTDAYHYSPAFAQAVWPLAHPLPWLAFGIAWSLLSAAVFGWLLAPLGWRIAIPGVMCCADEIALGNIHALLAAAVVAGMARPAVWAFPLLTKVAPGLGPVWFAARGEYRKAAVAVAATVAIAGVSFAISPKSGSTDVSVGVVG